MKSILIKIVISVSALVLVVGCSNSNSSSKIKEKNQAPPVSSSSDKSSDASSIDNKKNEGTIKTYLKNEYTGPNGELKNAMDRFYKDGDLSLQKKYLEENYKPIVTDNVYSDIVNANLSLYYLTLAYRNGFQLNPTNIVIKKEDNSGYACKVELEYSKNGKTTKVTVKEYININDEGKISRIRMTDDGGLLKALQ